MEKHRMRGGKNKQRNASAKADVANEERSMVWADETCLNTRTKGATLGISPPREERADIGKKDYLKRNRRNAH